MNKTIIGLIGLMLCLMILPMVNAGFLPQQQNKPFDLVITSNNATACNLTYIQYPDGTKTYYNLVMTKNGQTFDKTISSGNYSQLGTICHGIICSDGSTIPETGSICREITPSGSLFSSGQATTIFGSLFLMIVISIVLLTIAIKSESKPAKVIFFTTSTIGFVMSLLYVIISVQQTLFGFESIQTGIETFWFVAKIGLWLGFVALVIIIFLIMLRAWKIKRGLVDE